MYGVFHFAPKSLSLSLFHLHSNGRLLFSAIPCRFNNAHAERFLEISCAFSTALACQDYLSVAREIKRVFDSRFIAREIDIPERANNLKAPWLRNPAWNAERRDYDFFFFLQFYMLCKYV